MNDRATGAALEALCGVAGIVPGYSDVWGKTHTAPESTRRALLGAMGLIHDSTPPEEALEQYEAQTWRQMAPPVAVYREEGVPYRLLLRFPESAAGENHAWRLALETGETRQGEFRPADLERVGTREIGGRATCRSPSTGASACRSATTASSCSPAKRRGARLRPR
jgi:hypothetical protein